MNKFQFWATLVTAVFLGLIGYFLGGVLPLPFIGGENRTFYALLGVILGLLTFARFSSWVAHSVISLATGLAFWLASEVAKQVARATSRGMTLLPGTRHEENEPKFFGAYILDTSGIIDGRILEVAQVGFLPGISLVPGFVLRELQQVADSSDNIKRARGRRGFEVINRLKKIKGVKLEIWEGPLSQLHAGEAVDDALIALGKSIKGKIVTCDFNLNRVAKLKGVTVLNINELSNALKALPVPGEKLQIKLVNEGKDHGQGVGYLGDGTMVVVKDGADSLGKELEVEVTKVLQGPAGRMVFGKRTEQV